MVYVFNFYSLKFFLVLKVYLFVICELRFLFVFFLVMLIFELFFCSGLVYVYYLEENLVFFRKSNVFFC